MSSAVLEAGTHARDAMARAAAADMEAGQLTPLGKLVVRAAHRVDRTLAHERRAFERLADHLLRALAGLGAERAKVAHS